MLLLLLLLSVKELPQSHSADSEHPPRLDISLVVKEELLCSLEV